MTDEAPDLSPNPYALLWRAQEILPAVPQWLEYLRAVYSVDPGDYPFLSYVGVNFTRNSLKNYKFYFSFYKPLSTSEIERLLPVENRGRFEEFYARWHPTHHYSAMHRGVTFAVKVDALGALTFYYHLRVPGLPFGPPERLELHPSDEDNHHGVCEEFKDGQAHLKRYFYCADQETIARSLEAAEYDHSGCDASQISLLEYIESEGRDKMAWITSSPQLLETVIEERGLPRLASGLSKICHNCDFHLFGPGSAVNGEDHSVYFVQHTGPLHPGGFLFDGVQRFLNRHLKLDLL